MDEDYFVFGISNSVYCLKASSYRELWRLLNTKTISCLDIKRVDDGFIIHGEMSIFKVSFEGRMEWEFFGKDIFVAQDSSDNFKIEDGLITVRDWSNNIYKITLDGKAVEQQEEEI
jgi:hypothetical protein